MWALTMSDLGVFEAFKQQFSLTTYLTDLNLLCDAFLENSSPMQMRNTNIHPTDNLPFHCNHCKYVFFFYNNFISLKSMATILRKTG